MAVNISITVPTTQNVIKISPGSLVTGTGGGADNASELNLANDITVTNTDGAFTHVSSFSAGTSVESVLRQILEKYNRTTITLNSVGAQLQDTDGVYLSTVIDLNSLLSEVGRGVRITRINYTVGDSSQTTDDSVIFKINNVQQQTGLTDAGGSVDVTDVEIDPTDQTSRAFSVSVIDDGGDGLPDQTVSSNNISFNWYFRTKVLGSSTATIADATAATALYNTSTTAYNTLKGKSNFNVTATSEMDTQGNYTWIMYPASFGNLTGITVGGTPVLTDFESPVDRNVTNQYGVTESYRFYRSSSDDAFNSGTDGQTTAQVLTIQY